MKFAKYFPDNTTTRTIDTKEVFWEYDTAAEYHALRQATAVIDWSSATVIEVTGPNAVDMLEELFTREVEFLSLERSTIGMFLSEDAEPIDIVTVLRHGDAYWLESSPGRGAALLAHLEAHQSDGTTIRSLEGEIVILGFEGPTAWDVAAEVFETPIAGLPFAGIRPVSFKEQEVIVARTGVSGEFGFKVFAPEAAAEDLFGLLCEHATPIGMGAVEAASVEVRQPIFYLEVVGNTVAGTGTNWLVDLEKEEFCGFDAVKDQIEYEFSSVAYVAEQKPIVGSDVFVEDEHVGRIISAVYSPGLEQWCGAAEIRKDYAASGLVYVADPAHNAVRLLSVSAPINIPTSWYKVAEERLAEMEAADA